MTSLGLASMMSPSVKKTELQFWLRCRGLKYKSADTRAVLQARYDFIFIILFTMIDPIHN